MTRGEKIVAFMEAYCKIPEGAQVAQVVHWIIKACADSAKLEDAHRFDL